MRVVETLKVNAVNFGGGKIYSVLPKNKEKIENGYLGTVGALVKGETDIREFDKITNITENAEIVLIAQPEMRYDFQERADKRRFEDFTIEDGQVLRAYSLSVGDEFGLSVDSIKPENGNLEIGKSVILKNNTFELEEKATGSEGGAKFILSIEGFYQMNREFQVAKGKVLAPTKMVRLRVKKYEM